VEEETKMTKEKSEKLDAVNALIKNTDKENPKPEHLEALRKELDEKPELARIIGNINKQVFAGILDQATSKSALLKECAERYINEMKAELGYHSSTFVEKMLIDEIVMRWLRLQVMESDHKNTTYKSHSLTEGIYIDKRLHLAQSRFLRAIETLAKVRRMIAQTQAKGAEMFKNLMIKDD
jgi:hypothetical protein